MNAPNWPDIVRRVQAVAVLARVVERPDDAVLVIRRGRFLLRVPARYWEVAAYRYHAVMFDVNDDGEVVGTVYVHPDAEPDGLTSI